MVPREEFGRRRIMIGGSKVLSREARIDSLKEGERRIRLLSEKLKGTSFNLEK